MGPMLDVVVLTAIAGSAGVVLALAATAVSCLFLDLFLAAPTPATWQRFSGGRASTHFRESRAFRSVGSDEARTRQSSGEWRTGAQDRAFSFDEDQRRACRILGVSPNSSLDQIRSAYRCRARVFHPDRLATVGSDAWLTANERMKEINVGYEILIRSWQDRRAWLSGEQRRSA